MPRWIGWGAKRLQHLADASQPPVARASALVQLCLVFFVTCLLLLIVYALALVPFTPSSADLRKAKHDQPSLLISVDGKPLASFKRFNREWVPLSRIAPPVVQALIATEDNRFYQHHGVDFYRLAGAAWHSLGGHLEGGSTITQQLARNLYPDEIGRARSLGRKLRETITALKIEHAFSKQEILETYLNTVPFLYDAFGIEMASRTYFDKAASALTIAESATLIGMLKGASHYNPVFNPARATARRNVVLTQMVRRGVLSAGVMRTIVRQPIVLAFERQQPSRGNAPHFADHVRKWLLDWAARHDYDIYADGLKIYTTIDSRLQAAAVQAVRRRLNALQAVADVEWGIASERQIGSTTEPYAAMHARIQPFAHFWRTHAALSASLIRESPAYRTALARGETPAAAFARLQQDDAFVTQLHATKSRLEGGFIALDPTSGDIKAWVGSRDFDLNQFDHVARAQRQPGSTFKPFVYGAAIEAGMAPDQAFIDRVIDYRARDGSVWRPTDVTMPSGRSMSATEALVHSKNTITAQVMEQVGAERVADFARRAGVRQSRLAPVPSLALGTSPTSLLEMASAYATIADGGQYRTPMMVTRIEDRNGRILVSFSNKVESAIGRGTAVTLVQMLRGVVTQGTGQNLRTQFGIQGEVAGKTGTTQDNTDGWFMLMHPRLVAGAWVGFDDPRLAMRSSYWGQGAHTALPVVGDVFRQAVDARLIDTNARFARTRDTWFAAGIWGPPLDAALDWIARVGTMTNAVNAAAATPTDPSVWRDLFKSLQHVFE